MTIDEAIAHAREVAEKNRKTANYDREHPNVWNDGGKRKEQCDKCAEEHEQLVRWLEELRAYKNGEHDKQIRAEGDSIMVRNK